MKVEIDRCTCRRCGDHGYVVRLPEEFKQTAPKGWASGKGGILCFGCAYTRAPKGHHWGMPFGREKKRRRVE